MKRRSKRPATASECRRFAYDKKNVGIINKDIRNFAEVTNMRIWEYENNDTKQQRITKKLANLLCIGNLPLRIVDLPE